MDRLKINTEASIYRVILDVNNNGPIDLFKEANSLVYCRIGYYPFSKNILGMYNKKDSSFMFTINSNLSYGEQRYILGCLFNHHRLEKENTYVLLNNKVDKYDSLFSSYLLLPYISLYNEASNKEKLSIEEVLKIENKYLISHKEFLDRLRIDGYSYDKALDKYSNTSIKKLFDKYKISTKVYEKK